MIRTVDYDVLVLAIAAVQLLTIDELWIAFSSGKSFRYLPAYEMARALGLGELHYPCMDLVDATLYCAMLDAEKTVWDILMKSPQHSVPWQKIQIQTPSVDSFNYWSTL